MHLVLVLELGEAVLGGLARGLGVAAAPGDEAGDRGGVLVAAGAAVGVRGGELAPRDDPEGPHVGQAGRQDADRGLDGGPDAHGAHERGQVGRGGELVEVVDAYAAGAADAGDWEKLRVNRHGLIYADGRCDLRYRGREPYKLPRSIKPQMLIFFRVDIWSRTT